MANLQVARIPVGARAGITGHNAVVWQARGQLVHHALRVDRLGMDHGTFGQGVVPACAPAFDLLAPAPVGLVLQQGQQCTQGLASVTDQVDLHGVAQAQHVGLQVDLHATGLALLGQKLGIGEPRTDHQQGVAFVHHLVAGLGPQQADGAGHPG
ncbi:hypothetical protein D3C79_736540 [compost metagenome]